MTFEQILKVIDDAVWGIPLIVLILACGVWLTVRTRGLQVRHLGRALKYMVKNENGGDGDVSSFGALCTALSATIGTGNIVGVATAITVGGPGALFWMEVAAFFGMATKYAEGLLAIKYRVTDANGAKLGGPFYYIENGMGQKWKFLAKIFAALGVCVGIFGIGTFAQINGISSAANNFFDPNGANTVSLFGTDYTLTTIITGAIVTVCAALVIIGGIKRISSISQIIVPFMAIIYVLVVIVILICNVTAIPAAVAEIVTSAFSFEINEVAGGALGILVAMQSGISRGIFSNEAGLGSAPIAAAAAKTNDPVRQGLVTMTGTFIDTIIICTMTGLAVVIGGGWVPELGLEGVAVTTYSFQSCLSFLPTQVPAFILMVCLVFFAFTTILGWNYYSERCLAYLVGGKAIFTKIFRWAYILAVAIGPYMTVSAVWTIADIFNGLMAIPNIIALLALSGVVAAETKAFNQRLKGKKKAQT
ncbi:MAG: sodium:alanine symporter family protein [Oscillospiraceae bacterium]|nr:sodium:alanine symporter family protein [Oscillospiraceae bacterium]